MTSKKSFRERLAIVGAIVVGVQLSSPLVAQATGSSLANVSVRPDRMAVSGVSDTVRMRFQTSSGNGTSVGKVVVTFPAGYTVATSGLSATTAACSSETGDTALPGTLTLTGDNSAKTLTVGGVTGAANSTQYCVDLTGTGVLTNPSTGAGTSPSISVATQTSGGGALDNTTVYTYLLNDDQVNVNATVNPAFTFDLSANSDSIPAFSSGTIGHSGGVTATVSTNASKGWIAWVKSQNGALTSAAAGSSIATTGVGSNSHVFPTTSNDYGLASIVTTQTGTSLVADPFYASTGSDNKAGGLDSSILRPVASEDSPCTGDVITLKELAAVAATTPAANDYTDTLTVIGAGQF